MDKPNPISVSIVRTIKAPPEKVFAAWTDPETLKHWMRPSDNTEPSLTETDPRAGGRYRIVMRERNGTEHAVNGVYREFVPSRLLSFTWSVESTPISDTLVTVALRAVTGGTELTLTHTNFLDETARDNHAKGWQGCLDRLEERYAN